MSAFTKKLNQIKESLASDYGLRKLITASPVPASISRVKSLSRCDIKFSSPDCKHQNYLIRHPVIIETKNSKKKSYSTSQGVSPKYNSVRKTIEPFVPLVVPTHDRTNTKQQIQSLQSTNSTRKNHQIEIYIENDQKDNKECLRKLFKKIHTLEEQLGTSDKQRHKLQIQVEHLRKRNKECNDHDKIINKLEGDKYKLQGDKYKLEMEVLMLKKELKDENRKIPKFALREIVVEKPVQVRVQVPMYIPGPQRIVEKIVEVERKVPYQVRVPPEIIEKPVYIEVQKPVYIEIQKPYYVDKPVYIEKPTQVTVQKKVQIPFEVPVYIDRPVVDEEWMMRLHGIQEELGMVLEQNHELKANNHRLRMDNDTLRFSIDQLDMKMKMLQQHNEEKNREVESLLRNNNDYVPARNQILITRDNGFNSRITKINNNLLSPRGKRYY